jgi:hypothetical protein
MREGASFFRLQPASLQAVHALALSIGTENRSGNPAAREGSDGRSIGRCEARGAFLSTALGETKTTRDRRVEL